MAAPRLPQQVQKAAGISNGLRTATVVAVDSGGVTVSINGSVVDQKFGYLDSFVPLVGDTVSVFRQDSAWLVLGRATLLTGQWQPVTLLNNFTQSGGLVPSYRITADNLLEVYAALTSGATVASGTAPINVPIAQAANAGLPIATCQNMSTNVTLWGQLAANGDVQMHGTWVNGNAILINVFFPLDL